MNIKEGNNNLSIFLVSLIISILIWTSMSLSRFYNEDFSFPIVFKNIPNNKKLINDSLYINGKISASGWD